MSIGTGWDFSDHLQMLLYPSSKKEALKNIGITILMFIPIICVVFLSFLICGIMGLFESGKTKCDRCGKEFINTYKGQLWKFYDVCDSCSDKQMKVEEDFINKKSHKERKNQ